MARWLVIAVIVWLAFLTILTLIAIFRHSRSSPSGFQGPTVVRFAATVGPSACSSRSRAAGIRSGPSFRTIGQCQEAPGS